MKYMWLIPFRLSLLMTWLLKYFFLLKKVVFY